MKGALRAIFLISILVGAALPARAACVSPSEAEGTLLYNADFKVFQYCDGTDWVAMHPFGSGSGGCTVPDRPEGTLVYNPNYRVMQGCAGNAWRAMGPVGGSATTASWDNPAQGPVLDNPDPTANDNFGISVAVSGTAAVVGANRHDPGTAYVFDTVSGALIATLNNPDPTLNNDNFGTSVAVDGTTTVVGAHGDDPSGISGAGTAYVFDTVSDALIATLDNPDPAANDQLGRSVAVSGTAAVVGAYADDPGGIAEAGTAYIFTAGLPGACTGPVRPEGALLYNSSSKVMQYCDGAGWVGTGKGVPAGPAAGPTGCPNVGDVCPDGSVYAGLSPDGNVAMYTTPADAGFYTWNNGTSSYIDTAMVNCTDNTPGTASSCRTGEANTALLVGLSDAASPYSAAVHCDGLSAHGHTDWYLPALDELYVLYNNRIAIGGFDTSGVWYYWSSSENTAHSAKVQFSDVIRPDSNKAGSAPVRCVRRQ